MLLAKAKRTGPITLKTESKGLKETAVALRSEVSR